jgi:hypothetical protein
VVLPYTITTIRGNSVKVAYQGGMRTLALTPATVYISDGSYSSRTAFHIGDTIAYVATANNGPIKALVKLAASATYYSTPMQNQIILHEPCVGNPGEICSNGGGVSELDVHPYGERGANPGAKGDWKTIEGTLVSYNDSAIVLKSSSGALYTIKITENLVAEFNAQHNEAYNGLTIATDDTLEAIYRQPANTTHEVAADELEDVTLLVTGNVKTGVIQKY